MFFTNPDCTIFNMILSDYTDELLLHREIISSLPDGKLKFTSEQFFRLELKASIEQFAPGIFHVFQRSVPFSKI